MRLNRLVVFSVLLLGGVATRADAAGFFNLPFFKKSAVAAAPTAHHTLTLVYGGSVTLDGSAIALPYSSGGLSISQPAGHDTGANASYQLSLPGSAGNISAQVNGAAQGDLYNDGASMSWPGAPGNRNTGTLTAGTTYNLFCGAMGTNRTWETVGTSVPGGWGHVAGSPSGTNYIVEDDQSWTYRGGGGGSSAIVTAGGVLVIGASGGDSTGTPGADNIGGIETPGGAVEAANTGNGSIVISYDL